MKYIRKPILLCIVVVSLLSDVMIAQCNQEQTITKCDILSIDFDTDGRPDGIINLYAETGTTPADGVWSTSVDIAITLDTTTGNLSTWELRTSSLNIENYQFVLSNTTCGTDPVLTANLVLGAYSGIALPPDDDDINYYICNTDQVDLNTVLVSNNVIPVAHINGTWSLAPNNPAGGILNESKFSGVVDYQPGIPRIDQNVYELVYTVPGITPCAPSAQTTVKVSVVRQVDAGTPTLTAICESEIIAGNWGADIDVRDDQYLLGEDIEGFWKDDLNGTSQNLIINIENLYDALTVNGTNPRFGCKSYNFEYIVEKRSVVCNDENAVVSFVIYEQLRDLAQNTFPSLCPGKTEDPPLIVELYDLIGFTPGFEYFSEEFTNWEFISGPSDLGLVTKRTTDPMLSIDDLRCMEDPAITDDALEAPYYDPKGSVNITGAQAGEYRFRFYVCSEVVGFGCDQCPNREIEVVLQILPEDYAGEDTIVELCESEGSVDLRSLLSTNGTDTVVTTGTWTDADGNTVPNTFDFPAVTYPATFTFTYGTVTADNCLDDAELTLTVLKLPNAGTDGSITLCSDNLTITLFDLLGGTPDTTGIWTGPFGYQSEDHLGVFDAADISLPILGPGVYTYTVPGNTSCTDPDVASVTISVVDPVAIGTDRFDTFCKIDGRVNLFSILDNDTPRIGGFEDTDGTGALLADGTLEFETLTNGIFNFRYVIPNTAPCDESALVVSVQLVDLPEPVVPAQEFCILDAARLDDIPVDVSNYNWYSTIESTSPIIDNPLLFDEQVFYIATVDADNCESERVSVSVTILNMGERFADGSICTLDFQDGVSPDGNNQNDTFQLVRDDIPQPFNIPEAFPDHSLEIFNRYGTKVFEGTINTQEFRGESNVSIRLGDDLPSGTYFYIFNPNFENNLPIQGSFYLSR